MPRVLICDKLEAPGLDLLRQAGIELDERHGLTGAALQEAIRAADGVIVRSGTRLTADLLEEPGKLRAVVFGYACHNTTLSFYQWCGDYAGFAQAYLQEKHPEALALFWIGCGADANPLPRNKLELCEKYGRELAEAVERVLNGRLTPISGNGKAFINHYDPRLAQDIVRPKASST